MALIDKTSIGTGNTIQAEHITRIIDALNESGSYEIIATGSFTGSFTGDGSGLTGITSVATASYAHYAVSASYEINYETSSSYADFAKTASYTSAITGSTNTLPIFDGNNSISNSAISTDGESYFIDIPAGAIQFRGTDTSIDRITINPDDSEIIFRNDSSYDGRFLYNSVTGNRIWTLPDASGTIALTTDTPASASYAVTASHALSVNWSGLPAEYGVAVSDETTDLTTGTAKLTFRMPFAMTLTNIRASVTTAPTGADILVDVNASGGSIINSAIAPLRIDATEKTSVTAANQPLITTSTLNDDEEITIDIDQIGSTVAGAGLKVTLIGYRT